RYYPSTNGGTLPHKREEKEIEEKPSLLRSSKLMARYRKDMMPQTLRIVPVNGRLVFDDSEKYCRDYTYPKKPTAKDFCLPELPGTDAKKRKQEPFIAGDSCVCIPLVLIEWVMKTRIPPYYSIALFF
ncbi:hypothetical protein GE061_011143, partial [Apolygus lucorum]